MYGHSLLGLREVQQKESGELGEQAHNGRH